MWGEIVRDCFKKGKKLYANLNKSDVGRCLKMQTEAGYIFQKKLSLSPSSVICGEDFIEALAVEVGYNLIAAESGIVRRVISYG